MWAPKLLSAVFVAQWTHNRNEWIKYLNSETYSKSSFQGEGPLSGFDTHPQAWLGTFEIKMAARAPATQSAGLYAEKYRGL